MTGFVSSSLSSGFVGLCSYFIDAIEEGFVVPGIEELQDVVIVASNNKTEFNGFMDSPIGVVALLMYQSIKYFSG